MNIYYIKASIHDLDSIAECHISCFSKTLGAMLGKAFMKEALRPYLIDENKCIWLAKIDDQTIGYVSCKLRDGSLGSASSMIQSSFSKGLKILMMKPWLLFHREMLSKYSLILKNIGSKLFSTATEKVVVFDEVPTMGIPGICVKSQYRGKGVAAGLIQKAGQEAQERNYEKLRLTVLKSNEQAVAAYLASGFEVVSEDEKVLKMEKWL